MTPENFMALPWIKVTPPGNEPAPPGGPPPANVVRLAKEIKAAKPKKEPLLPSLEKTPEGAELLRYAVPQVRFDHCRKKIGIAEEHWPAPNVIAACPNLDGQGVVAIHARLNLKVNELIYPGRPIPEDHHWERFQGGRFQWIKPVHKKWLYVFRDKKLVVELSAPTPGMWKKESGTSRDFRGVDQLGEVCFEPGPDGARYRYSLFLSPIRLTQRAIDYLLKDDNLAKAAVTVSHSQAMSVLLPDPFAWAASAQEEYHLPCVANYQSFITDGDLAARCFITSTLKTWCNESQDLRVRLVTQPEEWTDAHNLAKSELLWEARKAAAYLATCVDAVGFQAVQLACEDGGPSALSFGLQAYACISQQLVATEEGIALAHRLAFRPDSLLAKHIFHDKNHPPKNKLEWAKHPRAWIAAVATAEEILMTLTRDQHRVEPGSEREPKRETEATKEGGPRNFRDPVRSIHRSANAGFEALQSQAEAWKGAGDDLLRSGRFRVQLYLENIGIPTSVTTKRSIHAQRLYGNITRGERIGEGLASKMERTKVQKIFRRLEAKTEVHHALVETIQHRKAEKLEHVLEPFESYVLEMKVSVGSILEIANLCVAVSEYKEERDQEKKSAKFLEAMGAAADMGEHILSIVKSLGGATGITRTFLASGAGAFALVSSILDVKNQEDKILEAMFGEYDYGKAFGRGMQMVGSAVGAVGTGLSLAATLECGSSFGMALGGWFGAAAGALIAGGYFVAKALELTDKEQFAQRSFLGKIGSDSSKDGRELRWSFAIEMPSRNAIEEVNALLMMLAAFEVDGLLPGEVSRGDAWLFIRPGLLCPESKFLVEIETTWTNWKTSIFVIEVGLEDDRITQVSGPAQLREGSFVKRDERGMVSGIAINAEDPTFPGDRLGQNQGVSARVALMLKKGVRIPDKADQFVAGWASYASQHSAVSSMEKAAWKSSGPRSQELRK